MNLEIAVDFGFHDSTVTEFTCLLLLHPLKRTRLSQDDCGKDICWNANSGELSPFEAAAGQGTLCKFMVIFVFESRYVAYV